MLDTDFLRKKLKLEDQESGEPLSFCNFCQAFTMKDQDSRCCKECGAVLEENDFQIDEKFGEKPKFVSHGQAHWGLKQYDAELSREYLIRRYIKELSCKIEIPEFMQRNTESLVKKLIAKNPNFSKSLRSLCMACIFLNLRQKDPSYSIKNFSEISNLKPKLILKHMNNVKPFFFGDEKVFFSSSQRASQSQSNHEAFLINFLKKLDLKLLFSQEVNLSLSLLTIDNGDMAGIQNDNTGIIFPNKSSTTFNTFHQKMENTIRSKVMKYGVFLINSEILFPAKIGKNMSNYVISVLVVIFRAFGIPITMKRICEVEDLSLISISRITKEITSKILDEYMNQLELLSTTQQTIESSQASTKLEDKGREKAGKKEPEEAKTSSRESPKKKNEDELKKAIKFLFKKCPYQN